MKKEDVKKKVALQKKLKDNASVLFDKEKLPKVKKNIDELIEELNKELVENRKVIAENERKIMETVSYEQYLSIIQLI